MKFLSIWTPDPKTARLPPSKELMEEMGKLVEESMKAGTLLATGGLLPVSRGGARVRSSGGRITVIDGPFTESKELIAGFAILQAKSKEEAIEAAKRFHKVAGDGESELRQIMDGADGDFATR
jgi:hypothetical protein